MFVGVAVWLMIVFAATGAVVVTVVRFGFRGLAFIIIIAAGAFSVPVAVAMAAAGLAVGVAISGSFFIAMAARFTAVVLIAVGFTLAATLAIYVFA